MILQKQNECIGEEDKNIIIPNVAMNKIREREQAGMYNSTYM